MHFQKRLVRGLLAWKLRSLVTGVQLLLIGFSEAGATANWWPLRSSYDALM